VGVAPTPAGRLLALCWCHASALLQPWLEPGVTSHPRHASPGDSGTSATTSSDSTRASSSSRDPVPVGGGASGGGPAAARGHPAAAAQPPAAAAAAAAAAAGVQAAAVTGEVYVSLLEGLGGSGREGAPLKALAAFRTGVREVQGSTKR
jgi:hypothetical protein